MEAREAEPESESAGPRTERVEMDDGRYLIIELDPAGKQVYDTYYNADGTVREVGGYN